MDSLKESFWCPGGSELWKGAGGARRLGGCHNHPDGIRVRFRLGL